MALIGGVGGTLTILCYGYWIGESGRSGIASIRLCRIDLGIAYAMTVLLGLAMVIIGSSISVTGHGADLLVTLAARLEQSLGAAGKWLFLAGAFSAVFNSLLGVWQAVPYLFADIWYQCFRHTPPHTTHLRRTTAYRIYRYALAFVPMIGLWINFREVQKLYAIVGALFVPLLAGALLLLKGRRSVMQARGTPP